MQVIRLKKMAAFIVGALGVSAVGAQNVVFTNSNNTSANPQGPYTIQLKSGVPVTVAPNGDIRAQCEIAENGRCVGLPAGGGGGPIDPNKPTNVTLSTNATDAGEAPGLQVVEGTIFTINAGASNALACVRTVAPGVSGWSGAVAADAAGGQFSLPSVGTYTFDLKCLNDAGSTSASPLVIQAIAGSAPPPPPTGNCSPANDGFFPPTGLSPGMQLTFTQLWATNPLPAGSQPVGSALAQVKMSGGQYRAFEFRYDMLNSTNDVLTMYADTSNPGAGVARGANWRYVAVSECPGDLRMANPAVGGLLKNGCRVYATEGPFIYLNFGAPSNDPAMCNLDKNKTYYMNVTFDAPHDGFNPNQACSDALTSPTDTCGFRWSF